MSKSTLLHNHALDRTRESMVALCGKPVGGAGQGNR
jgi:hypothetical protein